MALIFARAKMTVTGTPGTGTVTLNAASTNFQSFASAGVANGDLVSYLIEEGTSWEIGKGAYTSAGTTVGRASTTDPSAGFASSSGSAVSFTSAATVSLTELPVDIESSAGRAANMASGTYIGPVNLSLPGASVMTVAANTAYGHPFRAEGLFDGIAINVTTLSAGNVRMGLYTTDKNGRPGTLIEEVASPPSTGTTGVKVGTFSATRRIMQPVWAVIVFNATPAVTGNSGSTTAAASMTGFPTLTSTTVNALFSAAFTYGALPSTATALTANNSSAYPFVALRTA